MGERGLDFVAGPRVFYREQEPDPFHDNPLDRTRYARPAAKDDGGGPERISRRWMATKPSSIPVAASLLAFSEREQAPCLLAA